MGESISLASVMSSVTGTALTVGLLVLVATGCGLDPEAPEATDPPQPVASTESARSVEPAEEESVELAIHMGRMQRYADKLGYSILGKSSPLAGFYLEEIGEVYEELSRIEMHDGMPIAQPAGVILEPALAPLEASLQAESWEEAWGYYTMLVNACNRCHTATTHQFIEILPVAGEPPYSQRFGRE